ncbi:MAG: hypothetical protein IPP98_09780 [Gemmatimonadetes bacterium]|nr:hypothetical protein [Gemmatimonadota bacterium]
MLIRRTLPAAIAAGTSTVSLPLGIFEPASLMLLEPGVKLGRVSFDGASTEEALLRRHIGEEFQFERRWERHSGSLRAGLIALQPERWQVGGANRLRAPRPDPLGTVPRAGDAGQRPDAHQ